MTDNSSVKSFLGEYTVRAGTRLPDGQTLPRDFTIRQPIAARTGSAADAIARRMVTEQINAATGGSFSIRSIREARAGFTKAVTPERIRGGRPFTPRPTSEAYGGKITRTEIGKPQKGIYRDIREQVRRIFESNPSASVSVHGKGSRVGADRKSMYGKTGWSSGYAVGDFDSFMDIAGDYRDFEQWVGTHLRGSEDWSISVR